MAQIITHYLELTSQEQFRPALSADPDLLVMEAREPVPGFYRFLWLAVGRGVEWDERLSWSDQTLHEYLAQPTTTLLVLYYRGTPIGFIDLKADAPEPGTELAYFGIIQEYQGRGLGKHLLSVGVRRAFEDGASRAWLHTDNYDGPHALANYRARGFRIYRTTTHEEPVSSELSTPPPNHQVDTNPAPDPEWRQAGVE